MAKFYVAEGFSLEGVTLEPVRQSLYVSYIADSQGFSVEIYVVGKY